MKKLQTNYEQKLKKDEKYERKKTMNNYEKNEEKLKNLNNWRQKLKTFWEKNKKVEIKKMNKISFDKNWGKVGEKLRKSWQVMSPHHSDQMSQRSHCVTTNNNQSLHNTTE